jgi:hypothetical protein
VLAALRDCLPIAVGLALAASPVIIGAVVLVTRRPAAVSGAFVAGWTSGLALAGALVVALADRLHLDDETGTWERWLKAALGVTLLVLAARKWLGRPRGADVPEAPRWMSVVDTMSAGRAFGLAFLMAAINPKHLVLVVAGATAITEATTQVPQQIAALVVFVLVASLGVAAPAALALVLGARSGPLLARVDRWMTAHSTAIMCVVLLALGVLLIVQAVSAG